PRLRRAPRRRPGDDEEALPQLRPPPAHLDAQNPQPRADRPHRAQRRRGRFSNPRDRVARVKFEKWQALGNDYLIFEAKRLPWELTAARVEWLCDQHFGVGSDGVLLLS